MTELDLAETMASYSIATKAVTEQSGCTGLTQNTRRLFMGNLPKIKTEKDISDEVNRVTTGLVRVITYKNFENPALHRGFCFLDYESAAAAECAKQLLSTRSHTVFGCKTIVDWADPEPEHDDRLMATVRILFVRQYGGTLDEATISRLFGRYGTVERVKNLKNYAFVHFVRRQDARAAMDALNGTVDSGVRIEVFWAKPPADKRTREQMLRDRERRMQKHVAKPGQMSPIVASAANALAVRDTFGHMAAVTPYSSYDHYQYEFNRPSFGCIACQNTAAEMTPQRCQLLYCPCVAAVAAEAVAAVRPSNSNDEPQNHSDRYHHNGKNHYQYNHHSERQCNIGDRTDFDGQSTTERHDHGDFEETKNNSNDVINSNHDNNNSNSSLDANIIKFFLKVTTPSSRVSTATNLNKQNN